MNTLSLLTEWQAWQRAGGLSERTIAERTGTLNHMAVFLDKDLSELAAAGIITFLGRKGIGPASRATYHASIRAFCAWAVEAEHFTVNPATKTPSPKRPRNLPRPVAAAQLGAILKAATRNRTRMMVLLAALAGLRVHEVAKIQGQDIDMDNGTLTVTGKGGGTQVMPLHPLLIDMARGFPREGYWFTTYNGNKERDSGPVLPSAVGTAISRAMGRAGVHGTPHQLRHWYGTALLEQGVDLRTVQELMRHQSIASTQIYTKVSDVRRRAAINLLVLPEAA
ncbi:tyrosine-type recombinase/integrase [Arthrobacter sp. GMC3]|uniref:tyrosine-type recombinase/integrase n=1 Tax=Arthrobacter sp. GMC3 TaxID=2058894 RepID=UPI000CE2C5A5|nr:tyrosine-type recombinase/integrase [Arthrobacter sp. GMC3]